MTTKHTPTPWKLYQGHYMGPLEIVTDRTGKPNDNFQELTIGEVRSTIWESDNDSAWQRTKANAAFIVRAVNAHEELLRAAHAALNLSVERAESRKKWTVRDQQVHEMLEKAIARAEGK